MYKLRLRIFVAELHIFGRFFQAVTCFVIELQSNLSITVRISLFLLPILLYNALCIILPIALSADKPKLIIMRCVITVIEFASRHSFSHLYCFFAWL